MHRAGSERRMVTIGTDGVVDYVQTPEGTRYTLGPVSVLRLITGLVPTHRVKKALDEFLGKRRVMLSVDVDRLWHLLPFRRARFSSANPLIESADHMASVEDENAAVVEQILMKIASADRQIDASVQAGTRFISAARARADLYRIASNLTELLEGSDLASRETLRALNELHKRASEMHDPSSSRDEDSPSKWLVDNHK